MTSLTRAQERVLTAWQRLSRGGRTPSLDEVAASLDLAKSTVHHHVKALVEAGALSSGAGGHRSTTITCRETREDMLMRLLHGWMTHARSLVPTALANETAWALQ